MRRAIISIILISALGACTASEVLEETAPPTVDINATTQAEKTSAEATSESKIASLQATNEALMISAHEEKPVETTLDTPPLTSTPVTEPLPTSAPTPITKAEELYNPDETISVPTNRVEDTQISDQQNPNIEKQELVFWNERPDDFPDCTTDFKFSHPLANPKDVKHMFFGLGGHIEPHEHMLYWESDQLKDLQDVSGERRYVSRRIQLYAPTDIYRVDVGYANRSTEEGDKYVEWGGYLYICNGHQLMLGHIGEPSDEILDVLKEGESTCGEVSEGSPKSETGCNWNMDTFIPAGTPIFKNSGYTGAFDFGFSLFGLTAAELQDQPGYGYSITPWRVGSGRTVCPLEYFLEPTRSEYLNRLSDNMTGDLYECGPFNQDVPGTAMGFWMPSLSLENVPLLSSERSVDEWETIWLFKSNKDPSVHILSVGNNTFGLEYGQYQINTIPKGLVNRKWDSIEPGQTYCSEFGESWDEDSELTIEKILIIQLSEDAKGLTLEGINNEKCGEGPWVFQGGERTFYR